MPYPPLQNGTAGPPVETAPDGPDTAVEGDRDGQAGTLAVKGVGLTTVGVRDGPEDGQAEAVTAVRPAVQPADGLEARFGLVRGHDVTGVQDGEQRAVRLRSAADRHPPVHRVVADEVRR